MEKKEVGDVDVLRILWSKKLEIVVFSTMVAVAMYVTSSFLPKQYSAKATFIISPPKFSITDKYSLLTFDGYEKLVQSPGILQLVSDQLKPIYPNYHAILYPDILKGFISLDFSKPKRSKSTATLVSINVKGTDPAFLKDIANTLVNIVIEEVRQIKKKDIQTMHDDAKEQYLENSNTLAREEKLLHQVMVENHLELTEAELMIKRTNLKQYEYKLMQTSLDLIDQGNQQNLSRHGSLSAKKEVLTKETIKLKNSIRKLEANVYQMRLQEKQIKRKMKNLIENDRVISNRIGLIKVSEAEKNSGITLLAKSAKPVIHFGPNRFNLTLVAGALSFLLALIIACTKSYLDQDS